jgi:Uma2 family endonuclease
MMAVMTVAETPPDMWPNEDRPLTVRDLENTPDDGNRYELDEGMLVVSPAPFHNHQMVVHRLAVILELARTADFVVLSGPGINLGEFQHRIPDIAVLRSDGFQLDEVFEERAPVLAVEVASRGTRRYDRTRKKAVYAQYGVQAYWIVSPDLERPDVTEFSLYDGRYEQTGSAAGDTEFSTKFPFPVSFAPARLLSTEPLR